MAAVADRITANHDQCGGRPCVRGLRIRVTDVLDLLASGLSVEQVLNALPDLEDEDIAACLRFASRRLDHRLWRREFLQPDIVNMAMLINTAVLAPPEV